MPVILVLGCCCRLILCKFEVALALITDRTLYQTSKKHGAQLTVSQKSKKSYISINVRDMLILSFSLFTVSSHQGNSKLEIFLYFLLLYNVKLQLCSFILQHKQNSFYCFLLGISVRPISPQNQVTLYSFEHFKLQHKQMKSKEVGELQKVSQKFCVEN